MTLLAWHRRLVARKWDMQAADVPDDHPQPPRSAKLVIRIATENPTWGHRRVQGEFVRLGHPIAASTVRQVLHDAGIDPARARAGPTWKQFLAAQARGILAVDFVHVDTGDHPTARRTACRRDPHQPLHLRGKTAATWPGTGEPGG